MTEPTRDALHAETIHLLEGHHRHWKNYRDAYSRQMVEQFAYAAECVQRVPELEAELDKWREREASVCPEDFGFEEVIKTLRAEVERLRAKAAIVDAMERGEIELHHADLHAPGEPRTQWVCVNTTTHFGYRGTTARDALAAYAAATREGTDA